MSDIIIDCQNLDQYFDEGNGRVDIFQNINLQIMILPDDPVIWENLVDISWKEMRKYRGKEISFIFFFFLSWLLIHMRLDNDI